MTYGYPAPPPPPSTRRPIRMLVVGIVLAVLGVVGLAVAGGLGLRGTVGAVSDALDVRGRLVAQNSSTACATVDFSIARGLAPASWSTNSWSESFSIGTFHW